MSVSTTNPLTLGYRGMFADSMVYRMVGEKSIMSKPPNVSRVVWSKAQKDNRVRFQLAVNWAKNQLVDENKRRHYLRRAKSGQNAMNVAIGDYMRNLRVMEADWSGCRGVAGDMIRVALGKRYVASAVRFTLSGPRGEVLQSGMGKVSKDGITWNYKLTESLPATKNLKISVEVIRGPVSITENFWPPDGFQ